MNKKQIRRDYENVDYVDEKGKVRTDVVYKGKYFDVDDMAAHKKHKNLFCGMSVCLAALFVGGMVADSSAMRTMYFALPYAFQAFPVLFILLAAYKFLKKKLPYRQEVYDELYTKAKICCTVGAILSGICIISFIIKAAVKGIVAIDAFPICTDVVSFAIYVALNLSVRRWDIKEIEEEKSSAIDADLSADANRINTDNNSGLDTNKESN